MKKSQKLLVALALVGAMVLPSLAWNTPIKTEAAASVITTTATGYTKASDFNYVYTKGYNDNNTYLVNWGARGEDCVFLSKNATTFYSQNSSYSYASLSSKNGGSSQSNASSSALYYALQDMMENEHSHKTSYEETRYQYRYTDCVSTNYANISSFYSGKELNGKWDSAATWNREHTWPNSKGLGGNDENDIMMLRPTWVEENSSRGNTAYGTQTNGYFDPGVSTRGDCARIVLYVYTRWGNTNYMWGKSGVMENLNVLLDWMEQDPVDTWEMGRNDAVESITGTRNVFVDYPEYAWLLFGRSIPSGMTTPSGIANGGSSSGGNSSSNSSSSSSSSSSSGGSYVDSSSSSNSDSSYVDSSSSSAVSSSSDDREDTSSSSYEYSSSSSSACEHQADSFMILKQPTESEPGQQMGTCTICGKSFTQIIPATGSSAEENSSIEQGGCLHESDSWMILKEPTETEPGQKMGYCKLCQQNVTVTIPSLNDQKANENSDGCSGSLQGATSAFLLLAATGVFLIWKRKTYVEE